MGNTSVQYDQAINAARQLFLKKTIDYGTSWRVLRVISVIDQIYIKAKRIRNIQEKEMQMVADDIRSEFIGILNYSIIGLIQLDFGKEEVEELEVNRVEYMYSEKVEQAKTLMLAKNHDYGEAWRDMSQESFTDLILTKLLRIKQILQNKGVTLVSEGIPANYFDIINYSVFALIMIAEGRHNS